MKRKIILCFVLFCVLDLNRGTVKADEGFLDFSKLLKTKTFVDKTLLINELFNHDFMIVTAPRGFGKSTNVDMLKTFLAINVDKNGKQIVNVKKDEKGKFIENPEKDLTNNYKLFRNNNLNVYQNKEFFYEHCTNHTVIYFSFKTAGEKCYEKTVAQFKEALKRSFEEHRHLEKLIENEEDKMKLLRYLENYRHLTIPEVQCGLTFLARLLNEHYRKKPIVIFDDYDIPIFDGIYNSHKHVAKIIEFIRLMYSHLLIENANVERSFISAGNLKFAKLLSTYTNKDRYFPLFPNEFEYFPFLSNSNFSQYYGFTSDEVVNLLKKFKLVKNYDEIETWYGGYNVSGRSIQLFNVLSVLEYLKTGEISGYWMQPGLKHLKEILTNSKIQETLEVLLSGEQIPLQNIKVDVDYVLQLHRIFKNPVSHKIKKPNNTNYANSFVHFLTDSGYFNVIEGEDTILQIPNREIADDLADKMHGITFYIDKFNYEFSNIEDVVDHLKFLNVSDGQMFVGMTKSISVLYGDSNVILPKNDLQFYSHLYVFAKTLGKFKPVIGQSHAIGPRSLDILMIRKDGTAIAVQTKFKSGSSTDCLKEIINKDYYKFIKPSYGDVVVNDKVYIGLHLNEGRVATLSYLVNSLDLSKATNLVS